MWVFYTFSCYQIELRLGMSCRAVKRFKFAIYHVGKNISQIDSSSYRILQKL